MRPLAEAATGLTAIHALAASPAFQQDGLCFAAGTAGLVVSTDSGQSWQDALAALALQVPLTAAAVALSPDFARDRTLAAGVLGGVLTSNDGGRTWRASGLPTPPPFVTSLALSPNYAQDGLIFAGTMEDGVLRSWDRGERWAAWNFGLLDLSVFALALSPAFAWDDTLYVGVESGVFRSANGGRAWRETAFPMACAPVLSLAISPNFAEDGLLYASTEAHGLWVSADRGVTWRALPGWDAGGPVNVLMSARGALLAVTDVDVRASYDAGGAWQSLRTAELGQITCAAAPAGLFPGAPLLLGTAEGRVLVVGVP